MAEVKRSETKRLDAENEMMRLRAALDRQLAQCKQLQVINRSDLSLTLSLSLRYVKHLPFDARTAKRGFVTVGRPSVSRSVRPSLCIVDVLWPYRLGYLERNYVCSVKELRSPKSTLRTNKTKNNHRMNRNVSISTTNQK